MQLLVFAEIEKCVGVRGVPLGRGVTESFKAESCMPSRTLPCPDAHNITRTMEDLPQIILTAEASKLYGI